MNRIAKKIYRQILSAEKILLIPHQEPDGDAMGSVSAMAYFFEDIGKDYEIYCSTEVPEKLSLLPHIKDARQNNSIWQEPDFDTILFLDCGDTDYAGVSNFLKQENMEDINILNIDHHPSNKKYGHLNLIIDSASSTAEILYFFLRLNLININRDIAMSLLTGLITDTENFSNPGTTEKSLKVASELIHLGANYNLLKTWFLKNKDINALKLWGTVLSRLTKHEKHDVVYTYITLNDIKNNNLSEDETAGVANFLNNLSEGKVALILKEVEQNKKVKGSLRTTRDDIDVSQIAKELGGGGHKKASGFTIEAGIADSLEKIWLVFEKTKQM